MNVGQMLGLDEGGELLEQVRQRWPMWAAAEDRLAVVDDFDDLRGWLDQQAPAAKDEVLVALAMLAAPDGGDDVAAAGALAKCLLPGACRLAGDLLTYRRQWMPTRIEATNELVASQLWLEVRSFPWRRNRKVAANILWNTRVGVLHNVGDPVQVERTDRAWARTSVVEGDVLGRTLDFFAGDADSRSVRQYEWGRQWRPTAAVSECGPSEQSSRADLHQLLDWACRHDIITADERYLLLSLVEEAASVDTRRTGRGYGGLLSNEVLRRVAPRAGVSPSTVRRRTVRSVSALAAVRTRASDDV